MQSINGLKNRKGDLWLIISPDWFGRKISQAVERKLDEFYIVKDRKYFDYNGVDVIHYFPR